MEKTKHQDFLLKAIELAHQAIETQRGGPFGAVVVKDGVIVGQSSNTVYSDFDPTAHAEVQAIRDACKKEKVHSLEGCILYTSCEPCPMCYSALHFAKIEKVYYAAKHTTAGEISGFYMDKVYDNLKMNVDQRQPRHIQLLAEAGKSPFLKWEAYKVNSKNQKKSIQDKS